MNAFNEYGYDEGLVTLTIPEECRLKWRDWKKETRNWRTYIEGHIDEKHAETQSHVTSETNRAINDIGTKITTARDYVISSINTTINTKTNDIKSDIATSKGVIDSIWNKVRNL